MNFTTYKYEHNYREAKTFLDALAPDGNIQWQLFTDPEAVRKTRQAAALARGKKWRDPLARTWNGELDDEYANLCDFQEKHAGVYVAVNETDRKGRRKSNIVRARAVWADFDHGEPPSYPILPSIIVKTKRGIHVYWLVDGEMSPLECERILKGIIAMLGSDEAAKDMNRVLRVPGFNHFKDPADPFLVKLIKCDPEVKYTAEELASTFIVEPDQAELPKQEAPPKSNGSSKAAPAWDETKKLLADESLAVIERHISEYNTFVKKHPEHRLPLLGKRQKGPDDWHYAWYFQRCPFFGNDDRPHAGGYDTKLLWHPDRPYTYKCFGARCAEMGYQEWKALFVEAPPPDEADDPGPAGSADDEPWEAPVSFSEVKVPDFPVDALPKWLADFIAAVAVSSQTPPDMAAMMALGVLSAATGHRVKVQARSDWSTFINLYILIVALSGDRKSDVFKRLIRPIHTWEREETRRTFDSIRRAEAEHKVLTARYAELQKRASKENSRAERDDLIRMMGDLAIEVEAKQPPPDPRLLVSDCTPEKLAELQAAYGRIAIMDAEGGAIDSLTGIRYSKSGDVYLEPLLKGWDQESYTTDRIGRGTTHVDSPTNTLAIFCQPITVEHIGESQMLRHRGFIPRCVYSLPVSMVGHRDMNPAAVPEAVDQRYLDRMGLLLFDSSNRVLGLSDEACGYWMDLSRAVETRQIAEVGDLARTDGWGSKYPGQVLRVAGLLHMAGDTSSLDLISGKTMGAAIKVGEYLLLHAKAALLTMRADKQVEDAKRVVKWMSGRTKFTVRECFRGLDWRFDRVDELLPVLNLLERHGYIRMVEVKAGPAGGRPSRVCAVNSICRNPPDRTPQNPPDDEPPF